MAQRSRLARNWTLLSPPSTCSAEIVLLLPSCASDHARDRPICGNRFGQSELFLESTARHRRDQGQYPIGPRERDFQAFAKADVRRSVVEFSDIGFAANNSHTIPVVEAA
jgi:hypothetical protein